MKNTKDNFQIANIYDNTNNTYEVEVDGQLVGVFNDKADAKNHAELLSYVFDAGYEQKTKDMKEITEEDTYFPFELPDDVSFENTFAGDSE